VKKVKIEIAIYTAIIASLKMENEESTTNKSRKQMLRMLCKE